MRLIAVAKFVGVFGIRGELKTKPSPAGELTLRAAGRYALSADGTGGVVTFAELRRVGGRLVARLEGVETVEAATAFVGREIFVSRHEIVLDPGEFLDDDLIGLLLVDGAGTQLGRVAGVEHYPAQDCLVLADGRGMVPMVRAFVKRIDVRAGTILVSVPDGLIEP